MNDLSLPEYQALAEFRYQIRRFLHFSEQQARIHGLEPQQHQLLLAVRGLPDGLASSIGTLAERLQLRHHSVVELVDRMAKAGYVARDAGQEDRRQVIVRLTPLGANVLRKLSVAHRQEFETAPGLARSLKSFARRRKPAA